MKKNTSLLVLLCLTLLVTTGCAPKLLTKNEAFPDMYAKRPLTMLVLPALNNTTAADATELFNTTLTEAIGSMGYYSYPSIMIAEVLKQEGISSTEMLANVPPQKFKQFFGADAVMYITINKWDTSYFVIGGNVTVGITYVLKSTDSGEILWKYKHEAVVDTSGKNRGGGIIGLAVMLVETAVKTATQDYVPVANIVNGRSLTTMPVGKYNPFYNQDHNWQVVVIDSAKFDAEAH